MLNNVAQELSISPKCMHTNLYIVMRVKVCDKTV